MTRAKILRMYKLFTQDISITGRRTVTVVDALQHIAVILGLDVILLTLWTAIDPLKWERVVTEEDVFGDALESLGYCR